MPEEEAEPTGPAIAAEEVIGREVLSPTGEELGEVTDLILNPQTGDIDQAIIAYGGFLGIGEELVAVPWDQFEVVPGQDALMANISQAELDAAPAFEYTGEESVVVGPR